MKRHAAWLASIVFAIAATVSSCSLESLSESSGVVNVVIGYQSKTINTVTAGTLLRAQGYLERRLAGIKDNLLRLAVGLEDVKDITADLARGLGV